MMVEVPVVGQWSRRFSSSFMLDQAVKADLTERRGCHGLSETFKWLSVLAWAVPPSVYDTFGTRMLRSALQPAQELPEFIWRLVEYIGACQCWNDRLRWIRHQIV